MALTADPQSAEVIIADPLDEVEFVTTSDSESLSLSSSEMFVTEVTGTAVVTTETTGEIGNVARTETSCASSDVSFNRDDDVAGNFPGADLILDHKIIAPFLPEDSAGVILHPAGMKIINVCAETTGDHDENKENTKSPPSSLCFLPAGIAELGRAGLSSVEQDEAETELDSSNSRSCGSDFEGSESTSLSVGQRVKEDNDVNDHANSSKYEDVENKINELVLKCQSGDAPSTVSSVRNELSGQIRHMKRSDLETMVMDKITEAVTIHSTVGSLSQKLIQSNLKKDRLFRKMASLQGQVSELCTAVRSVSEAVGRNRKTVKTSNLPVRFYRSVGVQVVLEDMSFLPATASLPQVDPNPNFAKSVLKSGKSISVPVETPGFPAVRHLRTSSQLLPIITTHNNVNPGLKRYLIKPTTITSVTTDVSTPFDQPKIPRISSTLLSNSSAESSMTLIDYDTFESPGQPTVQLVATNGPSYHLLAPTPPGSPVFIAPPQVQNRNGAQVRPVVKTTAPNWRLTRGFIPLDQASNSYANRISISSAGGQIMMRPLKSVTATAASAQTQSRKQVDVAIAAERMRELILPKLVATKKNNATAAPSQTALTKTSSGSVATTLLSNDKVTRAPAPPVARVGTRANSKMAKQFVLPPLPPPAVVRNPRRGAKDIPPRPALSLCELSPGGIIVLSWTLKLGSNHAEIQTYQIYTCEEPRFIEPRSEKSAVWKRVGDVKALPLPMACTLADLNDGSRYHFIVRGVDVYDRTGPFCEAAAINLKQKS